MVGPARRFVGMMEGVYSPAAIGNIPPAKGGIVTGTASLVASKYVHVQTWYMHAHGAVPNPNGFTDIGNMPAYTWPGMPLAGSEEEAPPLESPWLGLALSGMYTEDSYSPHVGLAICDVACRPAFV